MVNKGCMVYSDKMRKYDSIKGTMYDTTKLIKPYSLREWSNTYFQIIAESWIPFCHSVRLNSNTERSIG